LSSNRREFIAGTGAPVAALSSLRARAARDTGLPAETPLAQIADELLADYLENAIGLGIDAGPPRRTPPVLTSVPTRGLPPRAPP
jgi:hypothetical protein